MKMTINEFADFIENIDDSPTSKMAFDMQREHRYADASGHPCGSACCIGGWAALLSNRHDLTVSKALAGLCDIPLHDAHKICWPDTINQDEDEPNPYEASKEQAADLLRHYAATGEVDWKRAIS